MDSELGRVLDWLCASEPLPADVEARARQLLLDALGCIAAGLTKAEPRKFAAALHQAGEAGPVRLPGCGVGLGASAAAAVAAMAACWDEACEGLARAHGRPGLHAIPPALALGLANGAVLGDVLTALVVGYEVGGRVGAAVRLPAGLHVDGTWGLFGAAAAAAHMVAENEPEARTWIEAATGVAACQAPQSLYLPVAAGATARNTYAAHAVATGMHLAAACCAGITSPDGALDEWARRTGVAGVETPALAGPGEWLILEGYLKPFAAARHVHYGAQAVLDWRGRGGEWGAIETLRLATYEEALAYCGNRAPMSAIQAQFSLSFGLAWAAVHGGLGPDAYTVTALQDSDVCRLEALAEIGTDDAAYPPGQRGARLTVGTRDGEQTTTVDVVGGDPLQPMTASQVREKFLTYAAPALGPAAENLADAILQGPPDVPIAKCLGSQEA